jgi:methionine-gamma-lyase
MTESTETRAVHAGRGDFKSLGVHAAPLDLSSTYPIDDLEQGVASIDSLASGEGPRGSSIYARLHNPTVARFEDALAELEGTPSAVAFASGMAALTASLLAAAMEGRRHVVAVRPLYGGSDHLLVSGLLGLEVDWVRPEGIAGAVRPDTGMVIVETPANPTLDLVDVRRAAEDAGNVPLLVDNTFATPILQNPAALGASLVLHSATKFLGGHGDVVGGVVATDGEWARRLRQVRVVTGGILHPLAAYLLLRGMPTLPMRVERAQETAAALARRLAEHPAVERVLYPGLEGFDAAGLVSAQMNGPGAILAFEPVGGFEGARKVMESLRMITPAVSLGSTDTLIQHPAGLTHRVVDEAAKESSGISGGLLRLSVGLEGVEDLWNDLETGLAMACTVEPADAPEAVAG